MPCIIITHCDGLEEKQNVVVYITKTFDAWPRIIPRASKFRPCEAILMKRIIASLRFKSGHKSGFG